MVGTLDFGVIVTLPICIANPSKAEFCTQKEGDLNGNQIKTGDGLILL
nr:MAG TPA: hypothetical protein [Caudoviricetes sp.]